MVDQHVSAPSPRQPCVCLWVAYKGGSSPGGMALGRFRDESVAEPNTGMDLCDLVRERKRIVLKIESWSSYLLWRRAGSNNRAVGSSGGAQRQLARIVQPRSDTIDRRAEAMILSVRLRARALAP